jgi:uncharacterized protein
MIFGKPERVDMENQERKQSTINRRVFIAKSAAAAAAASIAPGSLLAAGENKFFPFPKSPLPSRKFGNTGARVPLLTFGAAGSWLNLDDDTALKILIEAMDKGINSIDTAVAYGRGKSEERIGRLMPERRKDVLIHTKIYTRDKDKWWSQLENSLKRLKVEYVDSLYIHAWSAKDAKKLEIKDGVLDQLYKAKEQKLCRWIGVSCHEGSAGLLEMIRRHRLDSVMISLNVATRGFTGDKSHLDLGFQDNVLPEAVKQGQGVFAMKVYGAGQIAGKYPGLDHATCLRYALSLPVATAAINMPNFQQLWENIEMVKNFKPFSEEEMEAVSKKARKEIKSSFINFMKGHTDLA